MQGHLLDRTAASVLVVSFYIISKQEVFLLGWSS
jgi:hypothetical protein